MPFWATLETVGDIAVNMRARLSLVKISDLKLNAIVRYLRTKQSFGNCRRSARHSG